MSMTNNRRRAVRKLLIAVISFGCLYSVAPLARGDFVCCYLAPELALDIGGVILTGTAGYFDNITTFPPPVNLVGDAISSPNQKINFHILETTNPDFPGFVRSTFETSIPSERGVYVLYRVEADATPGDGPEGDIIKEGENFSLVHEVIPANDGDLATNESIEIPFTDLPAFGSPEAVAGEYRLYVVSYPEAKQVYDPALDVLVDEPYTDQDFKRWFEWEFTDPAYSGEWPSDIYYPEQVASFTINKYTAATNTGPECCSSVLFLPGIQGSRLQSTDGTMLWPPASPAVFKDSLVRLLLDQDQQSVESIVVSGLVNHFYTEDVYQPFTDFMNDLVSAPAWPSGEALITDWEPFAYDWRFDPETILEAGVTTESGVIDPLATVEALALNSRTGKVTIVAHSMGGMVGRALIKKLAERGQADLVDAFITVGTPQLGTPQAIAALLHGDKVGIPDEGVGIFRNTVVKNSTSRLVSASFPSAHMLVPSREYFGRTDNDPAIEFSPTAQFTIRWRNIWQDTIDKYTEMIEFLTDSQNVRVHPFIEQLETPSILSTDLLALADSYHVAHDTYSLPPSINAIQVAGWGVPTARAVSYESRHNLFGEQPSYSVNMTTEGDGIVVSDSAASSDTAEHYFFNLFSYNYDHPVIEHRDLLNNEPVQSLITHTLKGEAVTNSYLLSSVPALTEEFDRFMVSVYSPVWLGVYDEAGRYTGVDLNQDFSSDLLSIKEEIPGSSYVATGASQHVLVPPSGTYRFVYQGVGEGLTTLVLADLKGEVTTERASYTDVSTGSTTQAELTITPTQAEGIELRLDLEGDGEYEVVIEADTIGSEEPTLEERVEELRAVIRAANLQRKVERVLLKEWKKLTKRLLKETEKGNGEEEHHEHKNERKKSKEEKYNKQKFKSLERFMKAVRSLERRGKIESATAAQLQAIIGRIISTL